VVGAKEILEEEKGGGRFLMSYTMDVNEGKKIKDRLEE